MNFIEDLQFVNYYVDNVLKDLLPMMINLLLIVKPDKKTIKNVFFEHINENEYKKFCKMLNINFRDIKDWFLFHHFSTEELSFSDSTYFTLLLDARYYFKNKQKEKILKKKQITNNHLQKKNKLFLS